MLYYKFFFVDFWRERVGDIDVERGEQVEIETALKPHSLVKITDTK
jgi:hypothetical protein